MITNNKLFRNPHFWKFYENLSKFWIKFDSDAY